MYVAIVLWIVPCESTAGQVTSLHGFDVPPPQVPSESCSLVSPFLSLPSAHIVNPVSTYVTPGGVQTTVCNPWRGMRVRSL